MDWQEFATAIGTFYEFPDSAWAKSPIGSIGNTWHCPCIEPWQPEDGPMHITYTDIEGVIERDRWIDRAPRLPLVGFLIGSGLSLLLWGAIAVGAYAVLS